MAKAVVLARVIVPLLLAMTFAPPAASQLGLAPAWFQKLDPLLQSRASLVTGRSRIVVRAVNTGSLSIVSSIVLLAGGKVVRPLPIITGLAVDLPNASLALVAGNLAVEHASLDRAVGGALERTGTTVGAVAARQTYGYDGAGVGVAIIDSGVTPQHDDLLDSAQGGMRVDEFVDLMAGRAVAYDDYGHGTHVAGIVGGNGYDSGGARTGIAPAARLVALKVLDGSGFGRISDVIAALDYVVTHRQRLNIRVVNLSIAAGVYESYNTDPLTLAARKAVDAGIVVVAAAGNNGRSPQGRAQYGGVTAPGNAPWVLTVGAASHMGTVDRGDDAVAAFSSRGPTAIDRGLKPDIVAPGVGIESLTDPHSAFYQTKAPFLLSGSVATAYLPYLSLSGTSMAAPVVSGTVALMLQANPALTPQQVKAILQHTAQVYLPYDRYTQGAGFLDANAAVEQTHSLAATASALLPTWLTGSPWGSTCDSADCQAAWSTTDGDTVVWGTNGYDGDTVVWGTTGSDGDTVVWGTTCPDPSCEPVLWGENR